MAGVGAAGSVTAKDGMFMVNGQSFDLGQLMLQLSLDRTTELDKTIADQMSDIQNRNNDLKQRNDLMSQVRAHSGDGNMDAQVTLPSVTDANGNPVTKSLSDWFTYFGIKSVPIETESSSTKASSWDANVKNIQNQVDGLNNDSQLAMTRLQSLVNKRNQSFEEASNMLQKDQKTRDTVVGNLR